MKRKVFFTVAVILITVALLLSVHSGGFAEDKYGSIKVKMSGFKNTKGRVSAALFNSPKGFPLALSSAFKRGFAVVKGAGAEVTFKNVPYGTYAVVVFHDENANGRPDMTDEGDPKEGFSISNYNPEKTGSPVFSTCSFKLNSSSKMINLKLKYND